MSYVRPSLRNVSVHHVRIRQSVLAAATRMAHVSLEYLESRTLLSTAMLTTPLIAAKSVKPAVATESASAQLMLVSTGGTTGNPTFTYDITLTNTGTTALGTFWFAWVPGADFLPTVPLSASSPTGWGNAAGTSSTPAFTGSGNSADGTAIQWVAHSSGVDLQPGQSLSGFEFTTHDTLSQLASNSPSHTSLPVLRSFVYSGAPFSDAGFQFDATEASTNSTTATTTTLATSDNSVIPGDTITFTAVVTPASGTVTPTGTVDFVENGNVVGSGTLQAGGIATFTTSAFAAGTHSLTAVYSGDSTYSASTSSALTETVAVLPTIALTKLTFAASVVSGLKTSAKATVIITNDSTATIKGPFTIAISAVINGTSTVIKTVTVKPTIKANHFATVIVPLTVLPSLTDGDYMIVAQVADASQNVSSATFATPIHFAESVVQLVAAPSVAAPLIIKPGKNASLSLTLTNTGNINTAGPMTITLSLSIGGVTTQIHQFIEHVTLKPGIAKKIKLSAKIPTGTAAGDYSLAADISQSGSTISTTSANTITVS